MEKRKKKKEIKVALVHDHLAQDGGAEKVLKILTEIFPQAPIYTLLYEKDNADKYYKDKHIETSIIQKLPWGVKHYQWYMPFMPMAVEFFDLSSYDLVISDTSSFAKGVITGPETNHICYCHTPTRYLWSDTHSYINELKYNKFFKKIISLILNYVRIWDRLAADRVDNYIANSYNIKKRIKKYYKHDSKVIYPPVEVEKFFPSQSKEQKKEDPYFLIGSRLAPYKRIDIVIEAFKKLDKKLKIFGDGVDKKRLKKIAKGDPNIEFLGRIDDEKLRKLYQNCQAFIHPQVEDFGITPVEAMASGRPVIAFRGGGVTETVKEGKTGMFFEKQTPEAIRETVEKFQTYEFDPDFISQEAQKFSTKRFKKEMMEFIYEKTGYSFYD